MLSFLWLQDDLLFESLTVYETLYYAAMLRLSSSMSTQEKKDRVETVLKALGLIKCRGTIIGGFFQRCAFFCTYVDAFIEGALRLKLIRLVGGRLGLCHMARC